MILEDCVRDYHAYLKHEQGAAPQTAEQYQSWLRYLLRWMAANGYPTPTVVDFNTTVLRRFLYHLSGEKDYRPRTVRGAFCPAKGLAKFLVRNGVLAEDPTATIQMPKKDAAIRDTVSDADVRALLDAAERQRNPKQVALARCVLSLLVYGALRRQELLDLHIADVDTTENAVLVRSGKGRKSRRVFVPASVSVAVKEWLAYRPQNPQPWLLAFDARRRIHERGLATLLDELAATAGLRGQVIRSHMLRHWRASDLMKSGADLHSIMVFLGHTDIRTTQQYLHADEEKCRGLAAISTLMDSETRPDGKQDRGNRFQRQALR